VRRHLRGNPRFCSWRNLAQGTETAENKLGVHIVVKEEATYIDNYHKAFREGYIIIQIDKGRRSLAILVPCPSLLHARDPCILVPLSHHPILLPANSAPGKSMAMTQLLIQP
jgi:hypothetical protein